MISLLQDTAVKNGWTSVQEFIEIVALSQVTPGPIAVNMATFVGFRQAGVFGALCATAGVCVPSFVFVLATLKFLSFFRSKATERVFVGLRAGVTGLIASAAVSLAAEELIFAGAPDILNSINWKAVFICISSFVAIQRFKVNPALVIGISALIGIIIF